MIASLVRIRDDARPAVQAVAEGLRPEKVAQIAGHSAYNAIRGHLFAYNSGHPNRYNGARTNYYTGAAGKTNYKVEGDVAIVSINQVGFTQRYYGGTIKPVTKKFLTLPARAEAYGHRASEFPDLVVLFGKNGPYALARALSTRIKISRPHGDGSRTISNGGSQGGEVMFWLVKSVTQQPNRDILPTHDELGRAINKDVLDYAFRLWQRRAGIAPDAGGGN